jgi:hypothetical protein
MSYTMPAHSKNAGLMECGAKRSATPLYLREEVTRRGKAPSSMRYTGALQKIGNASIIHQNAIQITQEIQHRRFRV